MNFLFFLCTKLFVLFSILVYCYSFLLFLYDLLSWANTYITKPLMGGLSKSMNSFGSPLILLYFFVLFSILVYCSSFLLFLYGLLNWANTCFLAIFSFELLILILYKKILWTSYFFFYVQNCLCFFQF